MYSLWILRILTAAKLGANAILGVSMACCRAAAAEKVITPL